MHTVAAPINKVAAPKQVGSATRPLSRHSPRRACEGLEEQQQRVAEALEVAVLREHLAAANVREELHAEHSVPVQEIGGGRRRLVETVACVLLKQVEPMTISSPRSEAWGATVTGVWWCT